MKTVLLSAVSTWQLFDVLSTTFQETETRAGLFAEFAKQVPESVCADSNHRLTKNRQQRKQKCYVKILQFFC